METEQKNIYIYIFVKLIFLEYWYSLQKFKDSGVWTERKEKEKYRKIHFLIFYLTLFEEVQIGFSILTEIY